MNELSLWHSGILENKSNSAIGSIVIAALASPISEVAQEHESFDEHYFFIEASFQSPTPQTSYGNIWSHLGGIQRLINNSGRPSTKIESMVKSGSISQAREYLSTIPEKDDDRLSTSRWRKVLQLPEATVKESGSGSIRPLISIISKQNQSETGLQWIAVDQSGALLGKSSSRKELKLKLEKDGKLKEALFIQR